MNYAKADLKTSWSIIIFAVYLCLQYCRFASHLNLPMNWDIFKPAEPAFAEIWNKAFFSDRASMQRLVYPEANQSH